MKIMKKLILIFALSLCINGDIGEVLKGIL